MVTIRLSRGGSKKAPFYHITVTDSRSPRDGRYIERLGFYNPIARGGEEALRIDMARAEYWLARGAKPSDRVLSLFKRYRKDQERAAAEAQTAEA
ncbi:MAG: 30S ribosomal protein S16 [Gammaproteobacteria bacterium]|nr:MAG: 30S ribosomal protein S16 [Gammaproteobacteria bacterium]